MINCVFQVEHFLACVRDHGKHQEDFDFEASLGILTPEELAALWLEYKVFVQ